jgi:hypothetical protein
MPTNRKSFIIHKDSLTVLDELSNEQAGLLFKAIKAYQNGDEMEMDSLTKIAFSPFKNQFSRDSDKYANLCEKNRLIAVKRHATKSTTGTSGNQALPTVTKSTDNDSKSKSKSKSDSKSDSKDLLCENAFRLFYSAGLPKKNPKGAKQSFLSQVKKMNCDPMEFAELLEKDIKYRFLTNQFGINKLHPKTYLNNNRWEDDYDSQESNNGLSQEGRKLSASERIRAANELKYGSQQPSSGLGMAADGGDIREPVDQGEWRESLPHVEDRS